MAVTQMAWEEKGEFYCNILKYCNDNNKYVESMVGKQGIKTFEMTYLSTQLSKDHTQQGQDWTG